MSFLHSLVVLGEVELSALTCLIVWLVSSVDILEILVCVPELCGLIERLHFVSEASVSRLELVNFMQVARCGLKFNLFFLTVFFDAFLVCWIIALSCSSES